MDQAFPSLVCQEEEPLVWEQGTPSVAFVPLEWEAVVHWEFEGQGPLEELEAQLVLVPLEVEGDWREQQEGNHWKEASVGWELDWEEQSHCLWGGLLALWLQPSCASQVFPTQ